MGEIALLLLALLAVAAVSVAVWLAIRQHAMARQAEEVQTVLEERHRAMLNDLHTGLAQQTDRLQATQIGTSDRLRSGVAEELRLAREAVHRLELALSGSLSESREAMIAKLADATQTLHSTIDERLDRIAGRVNERLDEGFRKTNETFVNVMTRLATIDEAQKKIENLTGSVVSLQELLGDKRARGAFGEVQLEALVRNVLPASAFEMQATLSNGTRADCVLMLPPPTGKVAVDSKFPLENYNRMFDPEASEVDRALAQKQFRLDVRRHIDAISAKYIVSGETSDGAVMFVPAEAVFAEIHGHHGEIADYALAKRVWIVSPTTLMAVLNTARAVLKDVETRRQIHVIKDALARLAVEFGRFDQRMQDLVKHIRQAHEDAEKVQLTSGRISQRFAQIEGVEVEAAEPVALRVVETHDGNKGGA